MDYESSKEDFLIGWECRFLLSSLFSDMRYEKVECEYAASSFKVFSFRK